MTPEEIKKAVAEGRELAHRREYEKALALADHPGPSWDELTEEQREKIRGHNRDYWKYMNDLGDKIRKGII